MTELHDIKVRYETVEGIHTDTHEAARVRSGKVSPEGKTIVETGVCACCDAERTTKAYNKDNVVKVEYEPSDHERADSGIDWFFILFHVAVILCALLLLSLFAFLEGGVSL